MRRTYSDLIIRASRAPDAALGHRLYAARHLAELTVEEHQAEIERLEGLIADHQSAIIAANLSALKAALAGDSAPLMALAGRLVPRAVLIRAAALLAPALPAPIRALQPGGATAA